NGPSEFDRLTVDGAASLGGSLIVALSGDAPPLGASFPILQAGQLVDTFDAFDFTRAALPAGLGWELTTQSNVVLLNVIEQSIFAADFDEDSDVDGFDLAAWQSGFGSVGANHGDGDADGDGAANGADFLTWQRQFGSSTPASTSSRFVPEPTTPELAFLAAGAIVALAVIRRLPNVGLGR
ncbi:MAG: hypothetical protein KDA61_05185, partial [Planctomycetales bacterium]|nr:hypothetical protein [Planctomycetales bacterium]